MFIKNYHFGFIIGYFLDFDKKWYSFSSFIVSNLLLGLFYYNFESDITVENTGRFDVEVSLWLLNERNKLKVGYEKRSLI